MKRSVSVLLCTFLVVVLTACGANDTKKTIQETAVSSPKAQVCFTDKELGEELTEYEGIWERTTDTDEYDYNKIYIYRATQQYLWFSFTNPCTDAVYMRAEKKDDGKYHFFFGTKPSGHSYAITEGENGEEGTFSLHDGMITDEVQYEEWGDNQPNNTTNDYKLVEKMQNEPKMNVLDYLDNYHAAYQFYEDNNLNYRYIGMDKDSEKLSYFYHGDLGGDLPYTHPFDYSFGGITVTSTKSDCDALWGAPTRIRKSDKGYRCIYMYQGYQINIYFSKAGSIYDMTLFLKSRKAALTTYKSGNFIMRGSQIVSYTNQKKDEKIVFPKNAVAIEGSAFHENTNMLTMKIPDRMDLHMGAFSGIKRAKISFEEGRTEIPRYAFCSMTANVIDEVGRITITLPKSIRVIKEGGFSNYFDGKKVVLNMNEGLEEIGDSAVRGLYLDFPDSLKKIGANAILWSMYNGRCDKELILPPHLEEMGDHCIEFDEESDGEGAEKPEVPVVKIPASVKKLGKDVVLYGKMVRE